MLLIGVLLAMLLPSVPARAREGEQPASVSASLRYQITFVARSCASYADVMANRVRDDRMQVGGKRLGPPCLARLDVPVDDLDAVEQAVGHRYAASARATASA